jgi:hypothetical protein
MKRWPLGRGADGFALEQAGAMDMAVKTTITETKKALFLNSSSTQKKNYTLIGGRPEASAISSRLFSNMTSMPRHPFL